MAQSVKRRASGQPAEVRFPAGVRPALGPTQPPVQWVPEAPSSGVKRPGREADHSPPLTLTVREGCACKSSVEKPEGEKISWETKA
jgi:hypothetical protein